MSRVFIYDGREFPDPDPTRSAEEVRKMFTDFFPELPSTVLGIHSHGSMEAFFSATDDQDEQGLGLYMVAGRLNTLVPEVKLRVGVYGYFAPVSFEEVFE